MSAHVDDMKQAINNYTALDGYMGCFGHDTWRRRRQDEALGLDDKGVVTALNSLKGKLNDWDKKDVRNLVELFERIDILKNIHAEMDLDFYYEDIDDSLIHESNKKIIDENVIVDHSGTLILAADESGCLLTMIEYMDKVIFPVINIGDYYQELNASL
ncbi:MAG: hypothetical protein QM500_11080 [Methylococcales bacterium]